MSQKRSVLSVEDQDRVATEQAKDDECISEDEYNNVAGDYWEKGDFIPTEIPGEKFKEYMTSSSRSASAKTGIQVSPASANSPIKAWRLIFTTTILERLPVVKHTNKYGERHAKDWVPIMKTDLTDFISNVHAEKKGQTLKLVFKQSTARISNCKENSTTDIWVESMLPICGDYTPTRQ